MESRRVVITGMGIVSAIGNHIAEFRASLRAGRCGIRPIELVDRAKLRFQQGAEVPGYRPEDHFSAKETTMLDRFAQFAVLASREAVRDAGLEPRAGEFGRAWIVTGTCIGGQTTQDNAFVDLYGKGKNRLNPMIIPRTMANAGASRISLELGVNGAVYTVSTACASSSHAIGQAYWALRQGVTDLAVTGGSEATFSMGILKAWEAMRVVSTETCRPFSKNRRGLILGEGGAMLVLESLEAARARGARILAEIVGFGMSSDAHHLTQPTVEGPASAMSSALTDAGLEPEQVDYINAHGTGTQANDSTETAAIRRVFGAYADRLPVSSTKSMHGHGLGAAGAFEAVASVLTIQDGFIPPTVNYSEPDPKCDLDVVPNEGREMKVNCVMSNSFAFGGLNAVLIFRAPDPAW